MPRFESANPTPREIYQQLSADWQELVQLFGRQDYPTPPDLGIVYHRTRLYHGRDRWYLRLQPNGLSAERKARIHEEVFGENSRFVDFCQVEENFLVVASPSPDSENTPESFDETLAHELTHSIVSIKEDYFRPVNVDELRQVKIPSWYRGHDIFKLEEIIRTGKVPKLAQIDMNEFYTPLGTVHLLEERYQPPEYYFLPDRLPQMAGDLLVKLYQGDIRAFMREHPQIAFLSSEELWQKYCTPLLRGTFKT